MKRIDNIDNNEEKANNMGLKKYKYYFKKPKSEIVKDFLFWLAVAGGVCIAASSPYFIRNLMRGFQKRKRYSKKRVSDTFYNLRKLGLIEIVENNHQIYIRLTKKGKQKVNWMQIDSLKITRPPKWDGLWRLVIFDISQLKKIYREALRGKLKELGFYQLQKSVWVHAFDCRAEVELLKDFFGLSKEEIRLVIVTNIGDDAKLREFFHLV
jgi:hypothetical protein